MHCLRVERPCSQIHYAMWMVTCASLQTTLTNPTSALSGRPSPEPIPAERRITFGTDGFLVCVVADFVVSRIAYLTAAQVICTRLVVMLFLTLEEMTQWSVQIDC